MSYYNNRERYMLLPLINGEKKVLQALVSAELQTHSINAEAHLHGLKASLTDGKKHSSSTLLRRKLKGRLVRELHEI
ncbi:hypothetical protein E2566_17390 [Pectobacterium punjabense]|uniref:Uncharacterized protein n=1 Tax=Pectobacterium punjabense TaxID=2108399 RepID=A0ABX6L5G2_9GAMM|nr:hypothetical protein [Pectobacterium punjabense]MBN3134530.1 hypothetical protein [Pectobacterium punjabense]MBS4430695.1 hypothetical protein [Pectobacterium punjabense]MBT9184105.1 hypothetical protein [Pectobacterium punjabense]MCE5380930.1 hypothetical protein [Pectobacterium punjabense]MDG0797395.1 hypothetical protein [Pectobacterium punjabense]